MGRTRDTFAAMVVGGFAAIAIGGFLGLVIGFVVMLGTAPADGRDAPPLVSNAAAKQDRINVAPPWSTVVSEVKKTVTTGILVTMWDADGPIV